MSSTPKHTKRPRRTRTKIHTCMICEKRKRIARGSDICSNCYRKGFSKTNKKKNEAILSMLKESYSMIYEEILDKIDR